MNLLQSAKLTYKIFVEYAYPNGVPKHIQKKFSALDTFSRIEQLLSWESYERQGERYNLRVGNYIFPHMKLAFIFTQEGPMYYVDCHDTHFAVDENSPDFEILKQMRTENRRLKEEIERVWASKEIRIFAKTQQAKPIKSDVGKGLSILAIDDESPILDLIGFISRNLGANCKGCDTLAQAKAFVIENGPPDLIFCDIRMRGESGYDFVKWYRKKGFETPVYYVTGIPKEDINKDAVEGVVQKPFCNNVLVNIISNLVK